MTTQATFLVTHRTDRHAPIPRLLQYGTLYKWTQANQNTVWRSLGKTFSMRCRDTWPIDNTLAIEIKWGSQQLNVSWFQVLLWHTCVGIQAWHQWPKSFIQGEIGLLAKAYCALLKLGRCKYEWYCWSYHGWLLWQLPLWKCSRNEWYCECYNIYTTARLQTISIELHMELKNVLIPQGWIANPSMENCGIAQV